jgi:HD-GYP domain-containing protein (c-di-GMP phosphodiesterase class II)
LEVRRRSGTWFDPALVDAFASAVEQPTFWSGLVAAGLEKRVEVLEPGAEPHALTDERLDGIALAFADVIDSKSAYTIRHSRRVAEYADAVGRELGLFPANRRWLRRAALLHDVGKLGLSNAILDKRGTLDESERVQVRRFPAETEEILGRIDPFRRAAAARRGGGAVSASGETDPIPLETRIITVCDIYDALTSERPHRPAMSAEQAFDVLGAMHDAEIDPTCVAALVACLRGFGGTATRRAAA